MSNLTQPHDLAAEEAVLGAVLLSNVPLPRLIVDVGLTGYDFYHTTHAAIWDEMVNLAMRGDTVDEVTLRGSLQSRGMPDNGLAKIDILAGSVPNAAAVVEYANRVIELAQWRRVGAAGVELQQAVAEQDPERRQAAEAMLTTARRSGGDTRTPEGLREDIWRHLEGHAVRTWATPWPTLNNALNGGLRAGEVTLLGGFTSHGKSVVTDQLLRWCADHGAKAHLYSNEMDPVTRGLRVVAAMASVPHARLAQPPLRDKDTAARVTEALNEGLPFGVTQVVDWSADDIARDIRFRGWDVCALDLVHRLPFREERDLAAISRTLNAAAQASGAHLIAVVHLNQGRAVGATLPLPVLRDIRGSGMLANDADNVLFVHREEAEASTGVAVRTDKAFLSLAKCRNGRLEDLTLRFDPEHARFLEPARETPAVLRGGIANGD
jgi:replicative DNA helicase